MTQRIHGIDEMLDVNFDNAFVDHEKDGSHIFASAPDLDGFPLLNVGGIGGPDGTLLVFSDQYATLLAAIAAVDNPGMVVHQGLMSVASTSMVEFNFEPLINRGFELNNVDTTPYGWTKSGGAGVWTDERSTTEIYAGAYSRKFISPAIADSLTYQQNMFARSREKFLVKVKINCTDYDTGDIVLRSYYKTLMGGYTPITTRTLSAATTGWQSLMMAFIMPNASPRFEARIEVGLEDSTNTTVYFDDVVVKRLTPSDIVSI